MKKIACIAILITGMGSFLFAEENKFGIHFFNRPYTENFELAMYSYDSTWISFLYNAELDKAVLVLNENDIKEYLWNSQTIKISDKNISKIYEKKAGLYQYSFIVTLNGERLYAGKVLSKLSAMAIDFPVIYYDDIYENSTLQIYPLHTAGPLDGILPEIRARTMNSAVKDYFSSIRKIK
jgi:hypothetical protein